MFQPQRKPELKKVVGTVSILHEHSTSSHAFIYIAPQVRLVPSSLTWCRVMV